MVNVVNDFVNEFLGNFLHHHIVSPGPSRSEGDYVVIPQWDPVSALFDETKATPD